MAWETIENVRQSYSPPSVPPHGVLIKSRRVLNDKRYLAIKIGPDLARAAAFVHAEQEVRLMFGTGSDAGRIAIAVQLGGGFLARRQKSGAYLITISAAAAEGLFALDFPPLKIDRIEAVRPVNGQPPMFSFKASDELLDVGE